MGCSLLGDVSPGKRLVSYEVVDILRVLVTPTVGILAPELEVVFVVLLKCAIHRCRLFLKVTRVKLLPELITLFLELLLAFSCHFRKFLLALGAGVRQRPKFELEVQILQAHFLRFIRHCRIENSFGAQQQIAVRLSLYFKRVPSKAFKKGVPIVLCVVPIRHLQLSSSLPPLREHDGRVPDGQHQEVKRLRRQCDPRTSDGR